MSKRANIFEQGKPERPYADREEGPVEVPQRATAAQLARRNIKAPKGARRVQSTTSGLSQSANFGPPQQQQQSQSPSFHFGATVPSGDSSTNSFGFGSQQQSTPGGGAFGGNATSSFPPAQAPTPSNSFPTSSFPSFGGGNANAGAGSGFNPQPPSAAAFNFTAGGANPFASSTPAPATNGLGSGGFSSSIFNTPPTQSQPASNLFTAFTGAAQNSNPATTAPTANMFGTSAAPQSSFFGATSSAAQSSNSTATTAAPQSNFFGGIGSTPSTPAPAASGGLFNFGSTTQNTTSAQESASTPAFNFGSTAQHTASAPETAATPAASGSLFNFGHTAQNTTSAQESAPTPAASTGLFNFTKTVPSAQPFSFGNTNAPTPTPNTSLFGATADSDKPTPFFPTSTTSERASPQTGTASAGSPFNFGSNTPKAAESKPSSNMFNFTPSKPTEESETPAPKSTLFGAFGQSQQSTQPDGTAQNATSAAVTYPSLSAPLEASKAPFSFTPQKPFGGSTNNAPAATPSLAPQQSNAFTGFGRSPSPSKEAAPTAPSEQPKANPFANVKRAPTPQEPAQKSNPFASLPRAPAPSFAPTPAQAPAPLVSTMPTLTGAAASPLEAPKANATLSLPKYHVPKTWSQPPPVPPMSYPPNMGELEKRAVEFTVQITALNRTFREKLSKANEQADWTALSKWHHDQSSELRKRYDEAKKEIAAARGVTGREPVTTKRKPTEDTARADAGPSTSSKRLRGGDAISTPPVQQPALSSTTPKTAPPTTQTSNMFGNIIKNTSTSTPAAAASASPTNDELKSSSDNAAAIKVPAFGASSSGQAVATKSGFQYSTSNGDSQAQSSTPKSGFQVPPFQVPTFSAGANGSSNFASQFAKKAKTAEELAKERKKKAKDEDFDSEDESYDDWSARYDAQEAERKAEEEKNIKAASGFKFSTSSKTTSSTPASTPAFAFVKPKDSTSSTLASKPAFSTTAPKDSSSGTFPSKSLFSFQNSTSGASTPGLFGSRAASPAASTSGGQSVFDSPQAAQTPVPNLFGHLSSGPSSNNQDESDEEDADEQDEAHSQVDHPADSGRSTPLYKRRYDHDSGSESELTLEEEMRRKKPALAQFSAPAKPSLLSRITRADDDDTTPSDTQTNGIQTPAQSNGFQTPTNKPFQFFDFDKAGAQTAPPKDNTFKQGTPIKFGDAPATETKAVPMFKFQPATPSPAEFAATPAKAAPFAFLSANNLQSGPGSISGLSSRAGTPSSEIDTSGKDSGADNDDEDGSKSAQLDLSDLTDAERDEYDIVFHTELALAKRPTTKDGKKGWENFARGALWILTNKDSGKSLVRMKLASGAIPLNYYLLPKVQAKVTGASMKMVSATWVQPDGKPSSIFFAHKNQEIAEEFADAYNSHLPSS